MLAFFEREARQIYLDRNFIVANFSWSRPKALLVIVIWCNVVGASGIVRIAARNYASKAMLLAVENANSIVCIV